MINTALLIQAPVLQDELVSKTGQALSAGVVTLYEDDSRTTYKNWYYQTGSYPLYSYNTLPNPMTLSAAGTIVDVNGNDVLPMYYPYDETDNTTHQAYYITVDDQFGQRQFTRQNFPFSAGGSTPASTVVASLENYIVNGRFWRNIGTLGSSFTLTNSWSIPFYGTTGATVFYATLAPDQHDGFSMPDFNFIRTNAAGADTITFNTFAGTDSLVLTDDITPEYYINHTAGIDSGNTVKCYQFPISLHVQTLANVPFTATIQAQNVSGAADGEITLQIYQYLGSGVAAAPITVQEVFVLNSAWTQYTFSGQFPSTLGTLGATDNALYLQIQMPLNAACDINFCVPSIYLSTTPNLPTNTFSTYDQIDSVVNSPRTGDVRTSINGFYPFGWQPMNNGTIGNASSNASRENVDTWPLFNLIWSIAQPYNVSTTNNIAQMYTIAGSVYTPVTYGSTAIADYNANKALALTKSMGEVFIGTVPLSALLAGTTTVPGYTSAITVTTNVVTTTANVLLNIFNGAPVTFAGTSTLSTTTVYYVGNLAASSAPPTQVTTFSVYATFNNAITKTSPIVVASDSGTVNYAFQATYEGEYAHTQLVAELATHNHGSGGGNFVLQGGSAGNNTAANNAAYAATTANTGSSTPFNVTQPGVFMNIFIKL